MGGWLEGGVRAYVGVTRCGKTTKAIADARKDAAHTRFPIVTLNLGASLSFADQAQASCADEVIYDIYARRVHPKVWTPSGEAERWKFWKTVAHHGGVHVIVDEIKHIANHDFIEAEFANAVTVWGHGKMGPTSYYVTAQRPSFIHRDLGAAFDKVYVFRLAAGADANRIHQEYGCGRSCGVEPCKVAPVRTTAFQRGEYAEVSLGFED